MTRSNNNIHIIRHSIHAYCIIANLLEVHMHRWIGKEKNKYNPMPFSIPFCFIQRTLMILELNRGGFSIRKGMNLV